MQREDVLLQEVVMPLDLMVSLELPHVVALKQILLLAVLDLTIRVVLLHVVAQFLRERKAEAIILLAVVAQEVIILLAVVVQEAIALLAVAAQEATVLLVAATQALEVTAHQVAVAVVLVAAVAAQAVARLEADLAGEVNNFVLT